MPEVKFIAAIDDKRGIAKKQKIPWDLPSDQKYFKEKLASGPVAMGLNTYVSNNRKPFSQFENTVFSKQGIEAENVMINNDLVGFFENLQSDIWVAGGGQIFAAALPYATKLYLTRVQGDYGCDVFFPIFEDKFECIEQSREYEENGIKFRFETWKLRSG